MQELKYIAERLQKAFKLRYNEEGVKFLAMYIGHRRSSIPDEDWVKFINSCGAFLGQCILEKCGGHWTRNEKAQMVIVLGSTQKISPFELVVKQLDKGSAESVYTRYLAITRLSKVHVKIKRSSWTPGLTRFYLRPVTLA